jgi:hypothetical protein
MTPELTKNRSQQACLISKDGTPIFGKFDQPMISLGLDKFNYFNSMDKPANKISKYFDYKQFQFISINTGKYIIGVAIADIRYLANGFLYVYDICKNTMVEQSWIRPPTIGYHTTPSPSSGTASIGSTLNNFQITINEGKWYLLIDTPEINGNIVLTPLTNSLPMVFSNPTGYNGWTYTQKHNALVVSGHLSINNHQQNLDLSLAGYDFSAGYMRRETSWRWSSINSYVDGNTLGLNLAEGVNETGGCENVFWLNGKRYYLPPVRFIFERQRDNTIKAKPWQIISETTKNIAPQVDLSFMPINSRQERLNYWFIKSNFRQYIGHYNGVIRDDEGNETIINNILGLSEDHFARW